ncbi:MAG: hypothetical protein UR61_C0055G0006 [candidate division WS6 bacterium GW2011_GWE1_34_7]|uniref:Uncharacterized protein n=2 Tax=Candidatus Dojkabacteria TaxID=74243 RepID=A0A0G0B3X4_9BACT|nr:MAG: hypothetical protein UR61_C0055G0006 [candidate division WS6 bacterium GW2011_GWE1_34_7]KKP78208.1 MAG: hypothetical protein UR73_C0002G0003 [candidate division WS6 bacterium GW2011_GWF1_35_23]
MKKWSLIIILIVVVSLLLSFFGLANAQSNTGTVILLEKEENPKFIGSYIEMSSNGLILDRDEWNNLLHLLWDNPGCIVPRQGMTTVFYADWSSGWYWKEKDNLFGDTCFKLTK